MKLNNAMLICIISILTLTGHYCFYLGIHNDNIEYLKATEYELSKLGRIQMFNTNLSHAMDVTGVYHADNFYCVYTKGRTAEEIETTKGHEICHALIRQDLDKREHFCHYD